MSQEKFTIEDADNDGRIKREVGKQLAANAKRSNSRLWEMFQEVAEHEGREPWEILGDGALRALNDEDFSEQLANLEVDMSEVMAGQLRIEDAKFVQEFFAELGLNDEQEDDDWLEDTVRQRLQASTSSPIPRLDKGKGKRDPEMERELQRLQSQVDSLQSQLSEERAKSGQVGRQQSVDEVFSEEPEAPEAPEAVQETQVEVEVSSEGSADAATEEDTFDMDDEPDTEAERDSEEDVESTEMSINEVFGEEPDEGQTELDEVDDEKEGYEGPDESRPDVDVSDAATGVGDGTGEGLISSDDGERDSEEE